MPYHMISLEKRKIKLKSYFNIRFQFLEKNKYFKQIKSKIVF